MHKIDIIFLCKIEKVKNIFCANGIILNCKICAFFLLTTANRMCYNISACGDRIRSLAPPDHFNTVKC